MSFVSDICKAFKVERKVSNGEFRVADGHWEIDVFFRFVAGLAVVVLLTTASFYLDAPHDLFLKVGAGFLLSGMVIFTIAILLRSSHFAQKDIFAFFCVLAASCISVSVIYFNMSFIGEMFSMRLDIFRMANPVVVLPLLFLLARWLTPLVRELADVSRATLSIFSLSAILFFFPSILAIAALVIAVGFFVFDAAGIFIVGFIVMGIIAYGIGRSSNKIGQK